MSSLKIDIDTKAGVWDCLERVIFFNSFELGRKFSFKRVFETRKGWHIVLISNYKFDICSVEFDNGESLKMCDYSTLIIMYQILFGSDWKREMLNLQRVFNGVKRWNILFASSEHGENYADLFNEYLKMKVLF